MKKLCNLRLSILGLVMLTFAPLALADGNGPITSLSAVGPHSRTWSTSTVIQTDTDSITNVSSMQELATGMNYWDGQQWSPSDTSFHVAQGGTMAVVNTTQHKVSIAANLYLSNAVTVVTPDGITLNSGPLGIALFDSASGAFSLIGAITNCTGYFTSSNQLVFSNAFCGVCADVVYTVDKGAFHQDVVITGKLDPADWGYPTNTTRIQILTEFYNPPTPERTIKPIQVETDQNLRNTMVSPDLMDQVLTFGQFVFGTGRAYTAASAEAGPQGGALVGKQLLSTTNRTFLIESVPYSWIQAELQSLPNCQNPGGSQGAMLKAGKGKAAYAAIPRLPAPGQSFAMIKTGPPGKRPVGLVIDYEATISGTITNSFQSDTTYFISGPVFCPNPITIEGGAVFKYPYASSNYVEIDSALTLATASYRPVVFTAGDDNTVGFQITTNIWSGYTGVIQGNNYANPALYLNNGTPMTLSNIRVNYAGQALRIAAPHSTTWTIADSQFLNCIKGIEFDTGSSGSGTYLFVNNCLSDQVQTFVLGPANDTTLLFYNSTLDNVSNIVNTLASSYFTNCVLASTSNNLTAFHGDHNGFYHSSLFGTSQNNVSVYPYQTVGAGNYYLTDGSTFRQAGTTNIDTNVLADLSHKTTYPPIVFAAQYVSFPMTLFPQAQRDARGSPDLGWHYDPIDYAFGNVYLTNATLSVTPGTAIAGFNTTQPNSGTYSLTIGEGGQLLCLGSPTNLCHIVNYNTVQEQSTTNWSTPNDGLILPNYTTNTPNALINFRFTDFSVLAQDTTHIWGNNSGAAAPVGLQDCQLHGGLLAGPQKMILLTNCLLERVAATYQWTDGTTPLYIRNCLFWNGSLTFLRLGTSTNALIEDTMFDHTTISDRSFTGYTGGHNGYVTNCNMLTQLGSDVILTNSAYLTSHYGNYYIPTNSPLIHVGSALASSLQLYHYTMWTNQVIESTNIVSIGYHYVAANTNGMPLDTTGTGMPDYIKDANGNGLVDSGEINWTNAADLGLKVIITRPANNSTIP